MNRDSLVYVRHLCWKYNFKTYIVSFMVSKGMVRVHIQWWFGWVRNFGAETLDLWGLEYTSFIRNIFHQIHIWMLPKIVVPPNHPF